MNKIATSIINLVRKLPALLFVESERFPKCLFEKDTRSSTSYDVDNDKKVKMVG